MIKTEVSRSRAATHCTEGHFGLLQAARITVGLRSTPPHLPHLPHLPHPQGIRTGTRVTTRGSFILVSSLFYSGLGPVFILNICFKLETKEQSALNLIISWPQFSSTGLCQMYVTSKSSFTKTFLFSFFK